MDLEFATLNVLKRFNQALAIFFHPLLGDNLSGGYYASWLFIDRNQRGCCANGSGARSPGFGGSATARLLAKSCSTGKLPPLNCIVAFPLAYGNNSETVR